MAEENPGEVHPLYIRQEAQKVARFFAQLYVHRGLAFFGIGVALTFLLVHNSHVAGLVLLVAGLFLAVSAYDKLLYDRAYKAFEKRFAVSPRDYLASHPEES